MVNRELAGAWQSGAEGVVMEVEHLFCFFMFLLTRGRQSVEKMGLA
jgi:hypothetical protein